MNGNTNMGRRNSGFTLIELALTLGIMAMIAGAILVPLVSQISQRNVAATEKLLEEAKEALIGFAVARGRLPCPATAASNGIEQFDTANGGNAINGDCFSDFGFLPAVTLGFAPVNNQGYAIDAFGGGDASRIRYAVWTGTVAGVTWPFTKEGGMRTATASELSKAWLFHVCSTGLTVTGVPPLCSNNPVPPSIPLNTLTLNAPAVIWSVGANAGTGGTGTDEAQNPNPRNEASTDRVFVSHSRSTVTANEFDDVITWLSVNNMVSRMVLGGSLP